MTAAVGFSREETYSKSFVILMAIMGARNRDETDAL